MKKQTAKRTPGTNATIGTNGMEPTTALAVVRATDEELARLAFLTWADGEAGGRLTADATDMERWTKVVRAVVAVAAAPALLPVVPQVADEEAMGRAAYEAYCAARDWKAFDGSSLPQWFAVRTDLQVSWMRGAMAAVGAADRQRWPYGHR